MKFMNLTIRKRRPTMKISGKKGIAVILKIILVIIFLVCILSMAITPIFLKQGAITKEKLGATIMMIN